MNLMTLDNDTLLGSFLAHMHSQVRRLAGLDFEKANHPDSRRCPAPVKYECHAQRETRLVMEEQWHIIRNDLREVLGLDLKPFNELARPGPCYRGCLPSLKDPMRLTFRQLKKQMDKARRKNPELKMLRSWDLKAKERTEEEKEERSDNHAFRHGY